MRTYLIRGAIAFAVVLAVSAPAVAQQVLRGTVVDADGNPMEGVVIKIQDTGSNRSYEVTSDREGVFVQIGLNSGQYNVLAEKNNMQQILPAAVSRRLPTELEFKLTEFSHLSPEQAKEQEEISKLADAAIAAMDADQHDEAIAILMGLVEKFPGCGDCYFNLGTVNVRKEDFTAAEAAFKTAIGLDPNSVNAYNGLANLYNSMEKFDLAQQASSKAASLASEALGGTDANSIFNQGVILWNSGKFAEAKTAFEAALKLDPDMSQAHYQLGMANLNLGQVSEARAAFEQYLEVDPNGDKAAEVKVFVEQLPQ